METRATLAVYMAGDIDASGQIGRASGESLWRPEIDLLRSPRFDGIPHHLELTGLREASGSESGLNSRISNGVRPVASVAPNRVCIFGPASAPCGGKVRGRHTGEGDAVHPRLCDGPETGSVQPQALDFVVVARGCRLRAVRGCAVFSEATAFVSSVRSESGISMGRVPGFRDRGVGRTE